MLVLLCMLCFVAVLTAEKPIYLPNVECQPLPYYLPVNDDDKYHPYVINIHRCVGKSEKFTSTKVCVAKEIENVTILAFDSSTGDENLIMVHNHTQCHEQCKYNKTSCNSDQTWNPSTCTCDCNIKTTKQCETGFWWEGLHCACRCPLSEEEVQCGSRKIFSKEACGCICDRKALRRCTKRNKYLDPGTCTCTDTLKNRTVHVGAVGGEKCKQKGVISQVGVVVVTIIEAILIIVAYYLWTRYCCKNDERNWCKETKQTMNFNFNNSRNENFEKTSIETPTIEANPDIDHHVNGDAKQYKKLKTKSKKNKHPADIYNRPFLGVSGGTKGRKYRYEMNNLVPVSSFEDDKSHLTEQGDNNVGFTEYYPENDCRDSVVSITQI